MSEIADEGVTVTLDSKPKKKKVKIKTSDAPVAKKKAKKKVAKPASDKPKGKARARIDTSGARKEVKIAETLYDMMAKIADKEGLPSIGHAVDKVLSMGISRKRALDRHAKKLAKDA